MRDGGHFVSLTVSRQSPLFGDEEFNNTFFAKGFDDIPVQFDSVERVTVEINIGYQEFYSFIQGRSWSNLSMMTEEEINFMLSKIPKNITSIGLTMKICKIAKESNTL